MDPDYVGSEAFCLVGSVDGMISKVGPGSERISFRIHNEYTVYSTILLLDAIIFAVHSIVLHMNMIEYGT